MPVLQFKGKSVIESYHHTVPHHRLEFDRELSLLPNRQKPGLDGNLIIEGDNLIALKALLPTHAGRVKCIYIDPPYNTGNEGWVYNDNLTQPQFKEWVGQTVGKEGEDASRHDKWCCMMYPRLSLLRELLADDGVALISIDDNESHHLRILMDEIFGEDLFIGQIVWKTRNTDNRLKSNLSTDHESVLVYAKPSGSLRGRVVDRSDFDNPDNDDRGPYVTDPLTGKATTEQRPNLHHTIVNPATNDKYMPDPSRGWITDAAGVAALIAEKRIWWPPNPATGNPRKKRFLTETSERMPSSTFWGDIRGQSGADEVDQILGERLFAFPKLLAFMEKLLDLAAGHDDIVLDCTGGSGTTAHAILKLNAADNGNRRFIVIQQPHDTKDHESTGTNVCRDITAQRVRRAISGYTITHRDNGERATRKKVLGLGGSFTYVRVGAPLFGEYRDFGERPPDFEDLAHYIFYTETSRESDPKKFDRQSGFIGETEAVGGTSYYLLYDPAPDVDRELSLVTLAQLRKSDKNRNWVIYCEKFWMHDDQLRKFEREHGKRIRPMIVPFQLK